MRSLALAQATHAGRGWARIGLRWLVLALLGIGLAAAAVGAAADAPRLKAGSFTPALPAPDFKLAGSDGSELVLSRYRGKVVLMFFGFTHCTEVCPVTLATLAQARQTLGAVGSAVQVVYVTVDPQRDTRERLAAYLKGFGAGFVGATGQAAALAAMRQSYGVVAQQVGTGASYAVDHSSSVFLIDRGGRLRALMPYGRSSADYVHDIQLLLQQ